MIEVIRKYYIYIIVGIVVIVSIVLSLDFEGNESQVELPQTIEQEVKMTFIYIDIRGSIQNPGVYKVESGTRLFQLVNLAGGFTEDVNENAVNQSILLQDEMYVYIPNLQDEVNTDNSVSNTQNSNEVNINTASKSELETLPGVGPSTAQSIIDYREKTASFKTIEDIMNVPGIGEATFNEIKSLITV